MHENYLNFKDFKILFLDYLLAITVSCIRGKKMEIGWPTVVERCFARDRKKNQISNPWKFKIHQS
jgi:hypothetical protein